MIGHRMMGVYVLHTGALAQSRAHFDQAITLRSYRTSSSGDAFRRGRQGSNLILSTLRIVVARLSRACTHGHQRCAQICPRDRPSRNVDDCVDDHMIHPHLLRKLRVSKCARRRTYLTGGRKRCLVLEGGRDDASKLRVGLDRQILGGGSNDYRWDPRLQGNWSNRGCAVVLIQIIEGTC
jgi:hypothetical protein